MTPTIARSRRPLLAAVCGLGLPAVLAFGAPASTASAAPPEMLLSLDNVTFTPALSSGLFEGAGLLTPQESITATFWVQNASGGPADMRISVAGIVSPSVLFGQSVTLTTGDSVSGTSRTSPLGGLALCQIVVPVVTIAAGAVFRVNLTITMLEVSGQTAQDELGSIDFLVAAIDPSGGGFLPLACDDDGVIVPTSPIVLAHTGTNEPTGLLVASGILLGFGVLSVVARKRGKRDEPDREQAAG